MAGGWPQDGAGTSGMHRPGVGGNSALPAPLTPVPVPAAGWTVGIGGCQGTVASGVSGTGEIGSGDLA